MNQQLIDGVWALANSELRNYIAPGLSSWLVGGPGNNGMVRLFDSEREQREWITPHSHRFNFTCLVLRGTVTNILLRPAFQEPGELYAVGSLRRKPGTFGDYEFAPGLQPQRFVEERHVYRAGDVYAMTSEQIHSIQFGRGAQVLFFEGPEVTDESVVLEPWANEKRVPTFSTQPWMFERIKQ